MREHVAGTAREAAGLALRAGVDISLSWDEISLDQLAAAVREGGVDEALLDRAVRRVPTLKERLGLFENPYADPDRAERVVNCAALRADVAVVVVGEQTKGGYFSPDRTDGELKDTASLDLTGVQERLLKEVHAGAGRSPRRCSATSSRPAGCPSPSEASEVGRGVFAARTHARSRHLARCRPFWGIYH
ncbi:hypothetical protein ACWDBW_34585 [Streptomyces sp. NPDC001107]